MQTYTTSQARERILAKIRTGLGKTALPMPFPEADKEGMSGVFSSDGLSPAEAFATAFSKLGGKFVYCDNEQELLEGINTVYDAMAWKEVLCSEPSLIEMFGNNHLNFLSPMEVSKDQADACITFCEALIGRTGSILISSMQNMGRSSTIYYPVHIVVAYASPVVPDIRQGLDLIRFKYKEQMPSLINLTTGPSRTADIEKTLVVGVHGPAEIYCFFVNA